MTIDKLIKTKPQSTKVPSPKGTGYEELKRRMQGICTSLNWTADEYKPQKTVDSIRKYVEKQERILYSEISGFYFSLDEEEQGNFISNVEALLVLCMEDAQYKDIKVYALKIYDHVHLAIYQVEKLQTKRKDDELKQTIAQNLEPVKKKLEEQIESKVQVTQKEIYAQLISLIGIFTAMAFLVFGSISALDNIFNNFQTVSLCKIVIVGCVWGLCVLNLIFIFIYYVSKMTKLDLKVNSYRTIAWSNLVLISILLTSIWINYVKHVGIGKWFNILAKNNAEVVSLSGFAVIIILAIVSIIIIAKFGRRKNK